MSENGGAGPGPSPPPRVYSERARFVSLARIVLFLIVCTPGAGGGEAPAADTSLAPQPSSAAADTLGLCAGRPARPFGRSAADLYCLDLHAAASSDARGIVELRRVPGPYGVTVTPEGRHVYRLHASISGLPEADARASGRTFVAWVTTPRLDPVHRLGTVRNGFNDLGTVDLDQFLILVSAEEDPEADTRGGPLILRGRSPSMLMEPHALMEQAPAAARGPDHSEHAPAGGWRAPPMYPGVPMLPGLRTLRPDVQPLVVAEDDRETLPEARPGTVVELPDGGTLDLEAGLVRRDVAGRPLTMLAFNGQLPGPLIRVPADATIFVSFTNRTPFPSSIHWHGVRLDNPFDGTPGVTQPPVMPGETFRYRVHFRDAGIYWYHPHHREDVQQELGLYGNVLVDPPAEAAWDPVHREEVLILDDLLLGEEGIVHFGQEAANFSLMGRFGNVFLVNGRPEYDLRVARGSVVRFHLTNASNTRTLNLSFVARGGSGAPRMKLVGSDVGKFERQQWVENDELAAAIEEAHRHGVKVTAHLCSVTFREAVARGIDNLEHGLFANTDYYPDKKPDECPPDFWKHFAELDVESEEVQATFRDMVQNGVAMTSTLAVYEISVRGRPPIPDRHFDILAPEIAAAVREEAERRRNSGPDDDVGIPPETYQKALEYEVAFVRAGGLLAAGVDPTGYGAAPPGFGDQYNYELLLEAGFSPPEVVQILSANGAKVLGIDDEVGTIETGKRADLVVLRGDPERDGHIRDVRIVFRHGVGWDAPKLIESVRGVVGLH